MRPSLVTLFLRRASKMKPAFSSTRVDAGLFGKHLRRDSAEQKISKGEIGQRRDRFGHDAAPPEVLSQPVTQCRSMSMHVLPWVNADPASRGTVNLDTKICRRLLSYLLLQEFMRVTDCVRMRKEVAQAEPNFSVVCVLRERLRII